MTLAPSATLESETTLVVFVEHSGNALEKEHSCVQGAPVTMLPDVPDTRLLEPVAATVQPLFEALSLYRPTPKALTAINPSRARPVP